MKKILALVLSIIMLLSVMPVAYATPAEYPPAVEEFEEYLKNHFKFYSYFALNSYYYEDEFYDADFCNLSRFLENEECVKDFGSAFFKALEEWESYGYEKYYHNYIAPTDSLVDEPMYDKLNDDGFIESLRLYNKTFKPLIDMADELIISGKLVWSIDFTECLKLFLSPYYYYSLHDIENLYKPGYPNTQLYDETVYEIKDYLKNTPKNEHNQIEFDAIWVKAIPMLDMAINCLDGNHIYSEYISNNDATEEADGTKTATCEFCGTTHTVTDEGSKLVKEEESLSFFARLIALIKEFFAKIFSIFG